MPPKKPKPTPLEQGPTFASPSKRLDYVPGQVVVRFSRKAVSPAAARLSEGAHRRDALELIPESIGAPLDYLRTNAGLRSVEPVVTAHKPRRKAPRAERDRLAAVASVVGSESDAGSGLAVLDMPESKVTSDLLKHIRSSSAIEVAERLPARWLAATADPKVNLQWGLAAIRYFSAKRPSARKVTVAVLDTGIDATHEDLLEPVLYEQNGYRDRDVVGHGTHVAGVIAALTNNDVGISGVTNCQLAVYKVFPDDPDDPYLDSVAYLRALDAVVAQKVEVVNLSIAGGSYSDIEADLFSDGIDAGVTFVAAMGNDYEDGNPTSYPAAYEDVIAVGAMSETRQRSSFSNTGPHIDLCAPGSNVLSTLPEYTSRQRPKEKDYASWSGTSMATPHVAAAAALLKAKNPAMTPRQIAEKLRNTASPVEEMEGQGWTEAHGKGLMDLEAALS